MIFVDRNQLAGNVAIQPNQAWFQTATALTNQAMQDGEDHVVTDHYKHVEVKKSLEKLFNEKCAYCEGKPASQGPWDVEHYRPKGRVKENKDHHGYYWLAYTWDNLLPSCVFCNQNRTDQPTFDDPTVGPVAGKLDQFPLHDEANRAMGPNDLLNLEEPLLLNPCMDQDCEQYFRYDVKGYILVEESNSVPKQERAEETIKICHLNRRRLRSDRAKEIAKAIKAIESHELAKNSNNALLIKVTHELVELFTAADSQFAGAARFVTNNSHAFNSVP